MGSIENIATGSAAVDGGLGLLDAIFNAVGGFITTLLGETGSAA